MKLFPNSRFPQKSLKEVAQINPRLDKTTFKQNDLITFVPMAAVAEMINYMDTSRRREFKDVQKGYTSFISGDVLFAKVTPCMENGKVALVPNLETELGFGSTEFHVLRTNGSIHPKLLFYFLVSDRLRHEAARRMTGAVGLRRVPTSFLQEVEIPTPSEREQLEILDRVDSLFSNIDAGVQKLRNSQGKLELYKQSVLHAAICGQLLPQDSNDEPASKLLERIRTATTALIREGKLKKEKPLPAIRPEEIPFELPKAWEWVRLGDLFRFIDYRGKNPEKSNSGYRLITAKNVRNGYVSDDPVEYVSKEIYHKWMVRGFPKKGDLLFITEGHTMGFVAKVELPFDFALAQRTIDLQPYTAEYADLYFHFLRSNFFQSQVRIHATGSAAQGIKAATLKTLLLPLPSPRQIVELTTYLNQQFTLAVSAREQLNLQTDTATLLKQLVLRNAFEGKLV